MSRTSTTRTTVFIKPLILLGLALLLPACGGGGGGGAAPPAPAPVITATTGYYSQTVSDTVTVNQNTATPLSITDLQAMVHGNKFTLVSAAQNLAYYATLTSLSGAAYTANVAIYKDNAPVGNTTISGSLVAGTSLTGTFAGTGFGNGTFALSYPSVANNAYADVARIVRDNNTSPINWRNAFSAASGSTFQIYITGELKNTSPTGVGNFSGCNINGTVTTVSSTAIYQIIMTLTGSTCVHTGSYTGLATSRTQTTTDDRLVVTVTNGSYSMNGEFQ